MAVCFNHSHRAMPMLIRTFKVVLHSRNACHAGLLYCMEFLKENIDWLEERLAPLVKGSHRHPLLLL